MMNRPEKTYVPRPEWIVLDWHHACIETGALCIQQCVQCGCWRHPPRRCCPGCFSGSYEFRPVTGTGSIRSLAVSYRSLDPGWNERAPYPVLLVELDEGPSILAATDMDPTQTQMSQRVGLDIERRSDDFVLIWANLL